ncbi:murein biosynthesis integral membrane protein MurJ [soil metagenome]
MKTDSPTATEPERQAGASAGSSASATVGAGILLSRIAGLIRERVFAQFFGTSLYADVFRAGLRMPNVLQNLLGEGTLSASFIPVYAELLEQDKKEEAGRVAGAIFALLLAAAGALALLGIIFAPLMVSIFLPGFEGERRELTILVTRILFPMTGVLVLSAWSLGILNSHRRFFIPYFAPVLWNGAMIATLLLLGTSLSPARLVVALAWGALLGGALQFAIQLPWVFGLEKSLRLSMGRHLAGVREALRNAGPAILGRGVVQVSGWVDMVLASLLAVGGVAAIGYAQTLYVLPVSLFGMSVAAAELPELARRRSGAAEVLQERTRAALQRVAFYVVPSFIAFVLLGDVVVAALYQTGEFDRTDTLLVYLTLIGYAVGLLASTGTRLFSSTFFALRDTRTPARFAAVRVATAALLGFFLMIQFEPVQLFGAQIGPGFFGGVRVGDRFLGAVGLSLGGGIAAWIEWALLRRTLRDRIGTVGVGASTIGRMFLAGLLGAAVAWSVRWALPPLHPIAAAVAILGAFGVVYFTIAAALKLPEASALLSRIGRLAGR